MSFFSSLSLMFPSALWALITIPVLWFVLKMYPPSPKNIFFPPIQFLNNLGKKEETSSSTPIWLLIYRILIILIIIFAFANPVYNPAQFFSKNGPFIILVDNGWPTSVNWEKRKDKIFEFIDIADQKNLPVILVPTTKKDISSDKIELMSPVDARSKLETLSPNPWPSELDYVNKILSRLPLDQNYNLVWLWDGINHDTQEKYQRLVYRLNDLGTLKIINYLNDLSTKVISNVKRTRDDILNVEIIRSLGTIEENIYIRALGANGEILVRKKTLFNLGNRKTKIDIQLPSKIMNELSYLKIENVNSAGSIYLLDEKWKKRNVGIFGDKSLFRTQPLLSPIYYLDRALKPFSEIKLGELKNLINKNISVIFLPGIGKIDNENTNNLKKWISKGGILVRFAGPNLMASNNDLLPVTLRTSNSRSLGGALSWEKLAQIKSFNKESPFYGIKIQNDIFIRNQVIAEPSPALASRTWASLEDGTPLVTALKIEKGWNILFHVTANADWSNLPLSGTFVEILEKIISLSFSSNRSLNSEILPPYRLLDGFGRLTDPYPYSAPINLDEEKISITYSNSPGFYGNDLYRRAINLGKYIKNLEPLVVTFPEKVSYENTIPDKSLYLKSWLMIISLILIFLDYFLSLLIRGRLKINKIPFSKILKINTILLLIFTTCLSNNDIYADDKLSSLQPQLGYIETNNIEIDRISQEGLRTLGKVLETRTSILLGPPKKINITKDSISFLPLIYWPISSDSKTISEQSLLKIKNYIENGGLLVFDTRDANPSSIVKNEVTDEQKVLKEILRPFDLPALIPIPGDHVLRRSFYLLNEFPGRWTGEKLWVEATAENSRDGVSSIIIGRHDWAAAWAKINNKPIFVVVPGGEKQREYSYRFGINLVMYAMTGNYKADQVHIKSILRRLQNLNFNEGQKGSETPEHEMDSYTKKAINERFREIEDEENAK